MWVSVCVHVCYTVYNKEESWRQVSLCKKFGEQVPCKCISLLGEGGGIAVVVFIVLVFQFLQLLAYL